MSSPCPKSPEQSDKSKKYDRQIRLWGDDGQSLLENSKICLVNANGVGCEIMKGLILPGIGGFTIVDGSIVNENDLGVNFFLDSSSIGQSKASACMRLLQELNPDASGDFVDFSIDHILSNHPSFFEPFDVVIASNLNEKSLLNLSNLLWEANIPFVYSRSLGFFGSIRCQFKEHCVVETHPDNRQFDLRLENPFPALKTHLESTIVTSKVPWLIVLNKYLQKWKIDNGQKMPRTYKEKTQLREMIRSELSGENENYEEAIKAVNTAFGGGLITSNLEAIFNDCACVHLNKQSNPFWIMARAVKEFAINENCGYLPLPGIIPDMTADTESYINLQNIYRQQAIQDADAVYRKCQSIMKDLGIPVDTITEKNVRLFCREAANLTVIRSSKISDEYEKTGRIPMLVGEMEIQGTLTEHYVGLRAYEKFLTECGNIPGECYVENDTSRLKTVSSKMLSDWGVHTSISDDLIHEICRYGGSEVHSISAFIGGCVAQEVIKIITKQYKPIDNTFLYNGITSETTTLKLFLIKSAIFAGAVYYTKELGVWGDSRKTEKLYNDFKSSELIKNLPALPFDMPEFPADDDQQQQMRIMYNHAVKQTFAFLAQAPKCASELVEKCKSYFKSDTGK